MCLRRVKNIMSRSPNSSSNSRNKVEKPQAAPTQQEDFAEPEYSPDLELAAAGPSSPHYVTPNNILSLQRNYGNQAVQRMLQRQRGESQPATGTIQREGGPVMAPPRTGQYAMGTGPRVGSQVPQAPPVPQKATGQAKTETLYQKLINPQAKQTLITTLLSGTIQAVVMPALQSGLLVKTRKNLTDAIKGDAALYEKLGGTEEAREAKLNSILQQAVAGLYSGEALKGTVEQISGGITTAANSLELPGEVVALESSITRLYRLQSQRNWSEIYQKLIELDQQRTGFYSAEIPKTAQKYMESQGTGIIESLTSARNRQIKEDVRKEFNKNVDEQLAQNVTAPPPGETSTMSQPGPKYRKQNALADGGQEYAEYTAAVTGAVTAGAGASTKVAQLGAGGFSSFANLTGATEAIGVTGAAGGIAGVVGGALETVRGVEDMTQSSTSMGDRVVGGGGRTASGIASMVQQGGSAAYNIASVSSGAQSAAALTATAVAGGGAIAMGAADMVRGGYGAYKGHQREKNLTNLAGDENASDKVKSAAIQAASTQNMRKKVAGATVLKGALLVAGGVTLLVLATNPVGWLLLGGAALIGGLASLWRVWQKSKRKKQVAIRELGLEQQFKDYEAQKKEASAGWDPRKRAERAAKLAAVKASNPLHKKMVAMGYQKNGYDKFYADYIHDTAAVLHTNGVLMGALPNYEQIQMREIIVNMGFTIDEKNETPTREQIAKALST